MKKNLLWMLLFSLTFFTKSVAQERTISGRVTASDDGANLPGVNVIVKGTSTGTTTNSEGNYNLSVSSGAALTFSFVGFSSQTVVIGNQSTLDIRLVPDVKNLTELVVVGYGTQQKKDLTGAQSQVSGKDIQQLPVQSFEQAVQGRAAGVQIENSSGKVGGAIKIRVRGSASVSASNQPLYVVDGFPITKDNPGDPTNEDTNPLIDINPNDIESIEILKDAASAAIYGSRASNGVVLITTKRGKAGKTNFGVNLSTGVSEPARLMEFMNRDQYIQIMTDAAKNYSDVNVADGGDPTDIATEYSANTPEDWNQAVAARTNTNWQKEAYRSAGFKQLDLSASGGSDKTRFYIGGGYTGQNGVVLYNKFERISGRINLDHQATTKLSFGGGINMAHTINNRVDENNSFTSVTQANALAPITPFIDPATKTFNNNTYYDNPFLQNANQTNVTTGYRTLANVYGSYAFFPSLVFRTEYGLDLLNQQEDFYAGRNTPNGRPTGLGSFRTVRIFNYTTNNTLSFTKALSEAHHLEALVGMSYQQSNTENSTINGQGFPSDNFRTLTSAARITFGSSTNTAYSYLSYFARANYKFREKYLLSLSARMDGSSRFGANERYGFFPAASVGWVLSEESFLKEVEAISFAKLRSSIGVTGNSDIGDFAARGLYYSTVNGSTSGIAPTTIANPNLKWETTTQWDAGLDLGLFQDRISITADYYIKNTTDLLLNTPIPNTTGYNIYLKNVGSIRNNGVEFSLTSKNLVGRLKWTTSLNIAHNVNKVINLNNSDILPGGSRDINAAIVGQPLGVFYGKKFAGVDPANGDALYYTAEGTTTNDYAQAAAQVLGSPLPKHFGGITNTFSFAGFDLTVLFQYSYGNQVYRAAGIYQSANASGGFFDNQTVDQINYWKKPGDITNIPKPYLYLGNGEQTSSRWLYDASYLRLKTATLGYNLPKTLLSKTHLATVRLYVTGQNLLTATNYNGNDPEQNYTDPNSGNQTTNLRTGYDWYGTPQTRSIIFGLNVGFLILEGSILSISIDHPMKTSYKKYVLACLTASLVVLEEGCNDKLDINPTSAVETSTGVQTPEAILEGAYALLGSGLSANTNVDGLYGAELIMIPDLLVSKDYLIWSGTYNQYRSVVNRNMVNNNTAASDLWARAYQCIGSVNVLLANLDKVPQDQRETYEGEARFIRGIVYFELVRLYAQQWVPGGANTQLGVPLVLNPTVSVADLEKAQIGRSTVAQVYQQVLTDLNFAKDNLSAEVADLVDANSYHANSFVASGFLSRVYLQQSNFAPSRDEADRVINSGLYELKSIDQIYNRKNRLSEKPESIFEIQQSDQNNAGINNSGLYAFYGCGGSTAGNGRGDINPDSAFYNLYDEQDVRRQKLFYVGSCTKSGNLTSGKWKDPYSNYIVMRLAEMYLNRAESNYRLGTSVGDTPLNDLNMIKDRANAPTLNTITSVNDILSERRLELAYEGFGIHDIRRTQGTAGGLAWNDPKLILPIPLRELNANPALKGQQNEGY